MKKVLLLIFGMTFSHCFGELLYNVDFNSPLHTVGQLPEFGGNTYPKNKPTRLGYSHGTAEVIASYDTMIDQPLLLIPESHSSRPAVRIDFSLVGMEFYPRYIISTDLYFSSFEGSKDNFKFYFNTPIAHHISFRNDGTIYQRGDGTILGSFDFDTAFNFKTEIDLKNNNWSSSIDDNIIHSGIFHKPYPAAPTPPNQLQDISLILDYDDGTANIPVAVIDNFSVEAIPEPGTTSLIIIGFTGIFYSRRLRNRKSKQGGILSKVSSTASPALFDDINTKALRDIFL